MSDSYDAGYEDGWDDYWNGEYDPLILSNTDDYLLGYNFGWRDAELSNKPNIREFYSNP